MNDIPKVTVNKFVSEFGKLYSNAIMKKIPLSMVPTPFVWGPPGVGKSAIPEQLKEVIEQETGKTVVITDVRLLLYSPVDLRGIPVASANRKFAEWLRPKVFRMDPSENVVNILFLDELTSAPTQVQAAAYQITLDRKIGEHEFPSNCIVIGAGNRMTDQSVTFRMPKALCNRLQHYEIMVDFTSWRTWAIQNEIHPYIVGFLSFDNSKFFESDIRSEQIAFATPRTWSFVSNILKIMEPVEDMAVLYDQISACTGSHSALAFISWCKNHSDLPEVEDIFVGKPVPYPKTMDALYALCMSMIEYVKQHEEKGGRDALTMPQLEHMVRYAMRFPADYQACLFQALIKHESIRLKMLKIPDFREYMKRINRKNVLN